MFCKRFNKIFFIVMISSLVFTEHTQAQIQVNEKDFSSIKYLPLQEKIFVHTDKDFYVAGEIVWFKLYDVSADSLKPLSLSNVAYVEILNAEQKAVLQATVSLSNGSGNGSFYLPSSITSGNYIFRAYTNWMKNFSADLFFQKTITIVNTLTPVTKTPDKDSDNYDIGFFPEGGNLVNGIESKIGFKATHKYGNSINCNGNIVDENNQAIVSFSSLKFGMGSFYFTPEANHTYKALININGKTISQSLPDVNNNGYVMHVSTTNDNQISITIHSNENFKTPVYLAALNKKNASRGLQEITDNKGDAQFLIDEKDLQAGITHLILLNSNKQPVCERLVFIKPQLMQLNVSADKNAYSTRSEVSMKVAASNTADLSMAVYLIDSLQSADENNILNYLWLTSELKGRIESPGYYFNNNTAEADSALDNLLLTQGWSRFKWQDAMQNNVAFFHFPPEREGHIIEGKVLDKSSGLTVADVRVYLSVPGQHFRFASCVSNDSGSIFFDVKDFFGAGELVIQTAKEDSAYRVEIADPFSNQTGNWQLTPFNFSEEKLQSLTKHSLIMQVQNAYTINQLNRFDSPLLDSNAFYGIPDEKYYLDNYVRFNTMEEVLREYVVGVNLRQRQSGYSIQILDARNHLIFENNPLVLVDGVPIFDMNKVIAYNPLKIKKAEVVMRKYYLNSLTTSGILSYSTYKGDLDGFQFDPGTIELSYDGLQLQREFYSPKYLTAGEKQSRMPDYRNVLYWSPQITGNNAMLSFYTSDVKGKYVAVIQGIDENGNAGYNTTEFEVK